jgi:putative addiction module component (TIGR02574 family)
MTNAALKKVQSEAMSLPQEERAELARELIRSLDEPHDADASVAWDEEILRRLDSIDAGTASTIDRAELKRRITERLRKT